MLGIWKLSEENCTFNLFIHHKKVLMDWKFWNTLTNLFYLINLNTNL